MYSLRLHDCSLRDSRVLASERVSEPRVSVVRCVLGVCGDDVAAAVDAHAGGLARHLLRDVAPQQLVAPAHGTSVKLWGSSCKKYQYIIQYTQMHFTKTNGERNQAFVCTCQMHCPLPMLAQGTTKLYPLRYLLHLKSVASVA